MIKPKQIHEIPNVEECNIECLDQYPTTSPLPNWKKTHQNTPKNISRGRGFAKFSAEARSRWLPNQWGVVATSWNVTRPKGFRVGENPRKCWSSTVTLYRYTIKYASGTALEYWLYIRPLTNFGNFMSVLDGKCTLWELWHGLWL